MKTVERESVGKKEKKKKKEKKERKKRKKKYKTANLLYTLNTRQKAWQRPSIEIRHVKKL